MLFSHDQSTAIVTLADQVIAENNVTLRLHLDRLADCNATIKAIDLTGVTYLDSYALGQIIYCCTNAAATGSTVFVVSSNSPSESFVNQLIDIADLRSVLTIVDSLDKVVPRQPQ